jgi:O-antigen/teichoic acid export membrane protein
MPVFRYIGSLRQSAFAGNVARLMLLTLLAQSIYLVTGPLIGRLFTPEQFGLYGLFFAFVLTASAVSSLYYDFAIPAVHDDAEAIALTRLAVATALVLTPLIGLLFALMSWFDLFEFGSLPVWSGAAVTAVLLSQVAVQLLQNWRIRRQDPVAVGQASVTLSVIRGAVQVACGFVAGSWVGLAAGELIGRLASAVHMRRGLILAPAVARLPLTQVAKQYREFPLVLLPAQLIDSAAYLIQAAGVAALFGTAELGQYFLMRRTLDLPVAFAFRSLGDIFYARLSADARTAPDRIRPFFIRAFVGLFVLGAVGIIPLVLFGPALFAFVFGDAWYQAGLLAAIMAPAAVMNLAVAPVSRIFALTTMPQLRFSFSVFYLGGTLLLLWLAKTLAWDIVMFTAGVSVVTFVSYMTYLVGGYVASGSIRGSAS